MEKSQNGTVYKYLSKYVWNDKFCIFRGIFNVFFQFFRRPQK